MAEVIVVLITGVLCLSIWFYLSYNAKKFSYFKKIGLKGPKPIPIFGNSLTVMLRKPWELRRELIRKYGRVHGIYTGTKPHLFVADAEVLQQITTKDFDSFVNHDFDVSNKYRDKFLISLKDDHWRRVRALMSPTFTSGKMRRMFDLMDDCCADLLIMFEENHLKSGIIKVKEIFDFYTLDTIATCCYGFKLRRKNQNYEVSDATVAASNEFVRDATIAKTILVWRIILDMVIPKFIKKVISFEAFPQRLYKPIAQKAAKIIKTRRQLKDSSQFTDYLQCLLDANLDEKLEVGDEIGNHEDHHASLNDAIASDDQRKLIEQIKLNQSVNPASSKVILTDDEILSSAIFFLTVGIDTTSTLLTNILYILAWRPEVQEKLFQEILGIAISGEKRQFEYNSLTSAQYLDAVISETLRYIPIILEIDRETSKDCYIKKLNITVPKGLKIDLNYGCVMSDPEYWPNPGEFKPDRFLSENKHKIVPGSYCPFGLGPRHCIGMRFALTETKLAVASLLMKYRIEPAPNTTFPPEFGGHVAMKWIKNPIVKVVLRD